VLLFLCLATVSCKRNHSGASNSAPKTLTVFAAASLTESFTELARRFEAEHPGVRVVCNYAGSQQLEAQLEQGAPADVFASASPREMNKAIAAKLVNTSSVATFVHNHLVAIYSKRSANPPASLADLAQPGIRIDVADPSVPVGAYTQRMLEAASHDSSLGPVVVNGFKANVVSREENVKAVVNKVRLGEADAGIVYRSDLGGGEAGLDALGALPIPDSINQIAQYPIAAVAGSSQPALAQQFIALVCSPEGQRVLKHYGFEPPPVSSGKP
jgi:molybdate transport system substrate-binding protein